jgi:hypothetical protein
VLHLAAGTGTCPTASDGAERAGNPCWLVFGVQGGARLRGVEAALSYEGREPLDLLSAFQLRPPAATSLGASLGWVAEPGTRWRLAFAGEAGWRHYVSFAGHGLTGRQGAADLPYAGATARAALGLRPEQGRADWMEVTLAVRSDLGRATPVVDGVPWRVGGWSITMSVGLVSEW